MTSTGPQHKLSTVSLVSVGFAGMLAGFVLQFVRSGEGLATFVPPYTLPASLAVIALVLVLLAIRLRATIEQKVGKTVDPFFAVRLLAASRAAQICGVLFAGFSGGLMITLITRSVSVDFTFWLPMLFGLIFGFILLGAGIFAESVCRIPPSDDDEGIAGEGLEKPV